MRQCQIGYQRRKDCKERGCLYPEKRRTQAKSVVSAWPKFWELSLNPWEGTVQVSYISGSICVEAKRSWEWSSRSFEKKVFKNLKVSSVVRDNGEDSQRVRGSRV